MDNEQSEYLWDIILLIWWLLFLLFDLSYLLLLKLSSDRSNSSFVSIVTLFNLIVDPIIGSLELFVSSRILQFDISGHIGLELSIASRILGLVINSILLYIVGRMLVKRI